MAVGIFFWGQSAETFFAWKCCNFEQKLKNTLKARTSQREYKCVFGWYFLDCFQKRALTNFWVGLGATSVSVSKLGFSYTTHKLRKSGKPTHPSRLIYLSIRKLSNFGHRLTQVLTKSIGPTLSSKKVKTITIFLCVRV